MGFLSRAFVPRGVRRAAHPVRTAKSAATPRVVKQARSALNPIGSAAYAAERAANTKSRKQVRPRTLRALDESETQPYTPEQQRRNSIAINIAVLTVIAIYVILSLIFGWVTVLVSTIAIGIFIGWAIKEWQSI